jgi:hypothetical protein
MMRSQWREACFQLCRRNRGAEEPLQVVESTVKRVDGHVKNFDSFVEKRLWRYVFVG